MPTLRDTYRQGLSALLADADRLGSTPDDIAARVVVLAELRHAIAAGLGEDALVEKQKPAKVRLVWADDDWQDYLVPPDHGTGSAVCVVCNGWVAHYPGGRGDYDKTETCPDRATALRTAAEWARADGYEVPDHPDAAPAANADAPTLPPALRADDGWIAWGGGACPCSDWPEVEYAIRDGDRGTEEPRFLIWTHGEQPHPGDIIAYRRHR